MKKLLIILTLLFANPVFAQDFFEEGKTEYYKSNYQEAQKLFLKELQQNPQNYPCRYFLAHTYVHNNEITKAKEEYNKIITFSPVPSIQKLAMQSLYNLNNPEKITKQKQTYTFANNKDNYFEYIKLKGNYVRWNEFPINVYISPNEYSHIIKSAFTQWTKATQGLVSFNFVENTISSQITVSVVDNLSTPYKENYEAGLATVNAKNNIIYKSHIDILRTNPTTNEKLDSSLILTTTLHEIGHSLGIQGHSPNNNDLMSAINHNGTKKITQRDLNTLGKLYGKIYR